MVDDIIKRARQLQRREREAGQYMIWLDSLNAGEFMEYAMKIDPTLEAFFVAIALEHGTHPMPKFGVERNNLAQELTVILSNHKGAPEVLEKVRRNYRELGGRLLDTDPQWFYTKLADAYLTWLYEQEESKNLLDEALKKIDSERAQTLREQQGVRTRMRVFKI